METEDLFLSLSLSLSLSLPLSLSLSLSFSLSLSLSLSFSLSFSLSLCLSVYTQKTAIFRLTLGSTLSSEEGVLSLSLSPLIFRQNKRRNNVCWPSFKNKKRKTKARNVLLNGLGTQKKSLCPRTAAEVTKNKAATAHTVRLIPSFLAF